METIISKRYADGGVYITKEVFIPQYVRDSQLADAKNIIAQADEAQAIIDELTQDKAQINNNATDVVETPQTNVI